MNRSRLSRFSILFLVLSGFVYAQQDVTVYVTRTGKKYHDDGCRYLSKSKIPMKLSEAVAKYDPCSVCDPPILKSNSDTKEGKPQVRPPSPPPKKQETYSGRCQATTKKGTQCSRKAKAGSSYCWQHGG